MTPLQIKNAALLVEEREKLKVAVLNVGADRWRERDDPPVVGGLTWNHTPLHLTFDKEWTLGFLNSRLQWVETKLSEDYGVKL
jgi:hypothetical protein